MTEKERPENWRAEPGAGPASGGHLPPDSGAEPLWTELTAPLGAPVPSPPPERSDVIPRGDRPTQPERRPMRRGRPALRRVRRTVRKVDPWSVLKLSLFFYAIFIVIWLILVAILYSMLGAAGLFDAIENFREGFALGEGEFEITLGTVEKWALLIGVSFGVLASLINVFLAFIYNIASDLVGGLELTFVERDL
ncbi:MAG: DUF3566 domain-containing protein [Actinomycetota bacterium]